MSENNQHNFYTEIIRIIRDDNLTFDRLQTLLEISTGLNLSKSFNDIGNVVFDGLQRFEDYRESGGKIGVYFEEQDLYEIVYYKHHTESKIGLDIRSKLSEVKLFSKIAIEEKKTLLIEDSHSEFALKIDPRLKADEEKSMIFIPLYNNNKFIGLFSYSRVPKNSINKDFGYFLECIAKQIGIAISAILEKQNQERLEIELRKRNEELEYELRKEKAKLYNIEGIITKNPEVQKILDHLPEIANSDIHVLIEGETGTGKELFAKAIHNFSKRKDNPNIIIDCSGIPPNLIESELFGHKKGSFTGAHIDKKGKLISANGGTIFFDEIGELPIDLQPKILRFFQTKEIEPIGDSEKVNLDVRIIAATNRNLLEMVKEKRFREDLYYRLNKLIIKLTPLRERREDIKPLIEHFIDKFREKTGKNIKKFSLAVLELLYHYSYPGNVRELENTIEHAFALCKDEMINDRHLPKNIIDEYYLNDPIKIMKAKIRKKEEKKIMIKLLNKYKGNKSRVAKELGISRMTLYRKLKKTILNN